MARFINHGILVSDLLLLLAFVNVIPLVTEAGQTTTVYPTECPYPCLPAPVDPNNCPPLPFPSPPPPPLPPSQPFVQPPPIFEPPPSEIYPPPTGFIPYFPPPWYGNYMNAPPPPDPILPYFPWYYRHPLSEQQSSASQSAGPGPAIHIFSFLCLATILLPPPMK